jgi:hypothetical protein
LANFAKVEMDCEISAGVRCPDVVEILRKRLDVGDYGEKEAGRVSQSYSIQGYGHEQTTVVRRRDVGDRFRRDIRGYGLGHRSL